MKMTILDGLLYTVICIMVVWIYHNASVEVERVPMKCTSPFDRYVAYRYMLTDNNETLVTNSGRVYSMENCEVYEN